MTLSENLKIKYNIVSLIFKILNNCLRFCISNQIFVLCLISNALLSSTIIPVDFAYERLWSLTSQLFTAQMGV